MLDGSRLLLVDLDAKDKAMELSFQPKYGHIRSHHWFGDGSLAVAFASGYFVVLATGAMPSWRERGRCVCGGGGGQIPHERCGGLSGRA